MSLGETLLKRKHMFENAIMVLNEFKEFMWLIKC